MTADEFDAMAPTIAPESLGSGAFLAIIGQQIELRTLLT